MRPLLRLYPRAWLDRYGDELDDLLDATRATPSTALDLARGALTAHLRAAASRGRSLVTGGSPMSFEWPQRHTTSIALLALVITAPTLIILSLYAAAALIGSPDFSATLNGALADWSRFRILDLFLIAAPTVAVVLSGLSMLTGSIGISDGALRLFFVVRPRVFPVAVLLVALALTAFWVGHLGADFLAGRP